ncbi:MAG: phosphatase PAP2 family protein [Chitinophagaceae bacterium]|nr:phosphatase PAP2 family protein [Chitinophagaceae bacterium]MBL0200838.1 phosphatase PAP2 family protein [Chitinophagaceae bacterium]
MQQLIHFDKEFFKLVNGQWTNPFFDWIMPWLRNSNMWIPFYVFLGLLIAFNFKKQAFWIIAFGIITIILTDGISSKIIKPYFDRLRPFNDPDIGSMVRFLLPYRPGSGSFTSSHATNHFGLAMYLYLVLKKYFGKWMLLLFVWAFLICYAQVYVGVHFPGDVMGGAILGCLIGYGTAYILNRFTAEKLNQPSSFPTS